MESLPCITEQVFLGIELKGKPSSKEKNMEQDRFQRGPRPPKGRTLVSHGVTSPSPKWSKLPCSDEKVLLNFYPKAQAPGGPSDSATWPR